MPDMNISFSGRHEVLKDLLHGHRAALPPVAGSVGGPLSSQHVRVDVGTVHRAAAVVQAGVGRGGVASFEVPNRLEISDKDIVGETSGRSQGNFSSSRLVSTETGWSVRRGRTVSHLSRDGVDGGVVHCDLLSVVEEGLASLVVLVLEGRDEVDYGALRLGVTDDVVPGDHVHNGLGEGDVLGIGLDLNS